MSEEYLTIAEVAARLKIKPKTVKDKTPEELKGIHKVKLAFPGCRLIQEGADTSAKAQGAIVIPGAS